MNPSVSIILTTYNRPELLKESITSILSQSYIDFELLVIDNFSDFDFFELISGFNDARIKPFQKANNGIIAISRNYGIQLAAGEFIAFCDDDDLWETTMLAEQVNVMKKHHNVALSCTGSSFINNPVRKSLLGEFLSSANRFFLSLNIIPAKYTLLAITFITNSSVVFRKKIVADIGLISEDPTINTILDYDYYLRISLKYDIFFLNKKLVRYRFHSQQVSDVDVSKTHQKTNKVVLSHWDKLNFIQKIIFKIIRNLK